jgi:hypothetical protein
MGGHRVGEVVMKAIQKFFKKVVDLFAGPKPAAEKYFSVILKGISDGFEIVEFVAKMTPTQWDNAAMNSIRAQFPKMFDGSLTEEERKLYLTGVAGELLKARYPALTTTMARLAALAALGLNKAADWLKEKQRG